MAIIDTNIVDLESPMVHAKFQDHWISGSKHKIMKGFGYVWALWPSWSCDQDLSYEFMFTRPKEDVCR